MTQTYIHSTTFFFFFFFLHSNIDWEFFSIILTFSNWQSILSSSNIFIAKIPNKNQKLVMEIMFIFYPIVNNCLCLRLSVFSVYTLNTYKLFLLIFYWHKLDLQCWVNLCCTAKWVSLTHVHYFSYSFPLWFFTGYSI